jgi:hypothetical protein
MVVKDNEATQSKDYSMRTGFHIGGTIDFPMTKMFSVESGLILSTKGFTYNQSETLFGVNMEIDQKMNIYYVDIPVKGKIYFNVGGQKIYGIVGPYLGIGVSGNFTMEATAMGQTEKVDEDIKWDDKNSDYSLKRLDYGLLIGAGMEYKSFQFEVSYALGLANISTITENDLSAKNTVISISVGYLLNK